MGTFGALALHADVVPSATGRAELLAALFVLGALLVPLRRGPVRARGEKRLLSAGLGLLAMGSKESALPVALLAPVLVHRWHAAQGDAGPERVARRGMLMLTVAHATALVGVVAFRVLRMPWMALGPERAAENPLITAALPARLWGASAVLVHYAGHLVWPWRLAPDYSYAAIGFESEPALAGLGVLLVVAALVATWASWGRGPGFADVALGFATTYVVVSHVLVPAVAIVADRLFFFPSLWVVVAAALGLERALASPSRLRVPGAVLAVAAVAFAGGQALVATRDCAHWRGDITLLSAAVEARPDTARARRDLAEALADANRAEDAAWQLVVSMAIMSHFPSRVSEDAFPPALDAQPVALRLDALRRESGDCRAKDRLAEARGAFQRWGYPDAAAVVARWRGEMDAEPDIVCP